MTGKIITAVVLVAVLIIGGYVYMTKKAAPVSDTSLNTGGTPTTTGKKIAFVELVKQNKSLQCVVHEWVGDTDNLWTVYTDQGLVRAESGTVTTIVRDGYAYTWNTRSPKVGSKVVANLSTGEGTASPVTAEAFNVFMTGDYDCETSVVDATKFTLPSNVSFTEAKGTSTSGGSSSSSNGLMKPADGSADAVVCTMDAKMCPDGSYVGRSGPKCEFAPCPGN